MLTLLGLLALLALILAVPLEFEFDAGWPETERNRGRLRWAFGAVQYDLCRSQRRPMEQAAGHDQVETVNRGGSLTRKEARSASMFRALRVADLRRRLWRFVRDVWGVVHKQDLRIQCRVGLETPADTGLAWSVLGPVSGLLQSLRDCDIVLVPDFTREALEIAGDGRLRVYPIRVVGLLAGLLASPTVWRGVSTLRSPR